MNAHTTEPVISLNGQSLSRALLADLILLRAPYDSVKWERRQLPPLHLDWKIHAQTENSHTGYDGALFSTEIDGKRQFFIFHQGTNGPADLPSLARLMGGETPQQLTDARHFTKEAQALLADRYPDAGKVLHVGYSLGGPLAAICAEADESIIAFETPGIIEPLLARNQSIASFDDRLLNVLSPHSNFINSLGTHAGKVLDAGEKFWSPERVSIPNFVELSIRSHRRERLSPDLAALPTLAAKRASETGRPTHPWDALREYIADHMSEKPSVRERALASVAETIDRLKYDDKFMKAAADGLDGILGHLAEAYAQTFGKDKPMTIRTHPQVDKQIEHSVKPGFTQRVTESRQEGVSAARGS